MKIAVDFDGTIVEHAYPEIGEIKMFAFETLRELQKQGHVLILWTVRYGQRLDEAVEFCRKHGIEFYAVNKNYPEEVFNETEVSRKLDCDMFIDDKNLGGFIDWSNAWNMINKGDPFVMSEKNPFTVQKPEKKSFLSRIFG